jgi:putative FmdB family regulatory protein
MPTYDYVCATCGHEVEVMRSVHAEGPSACPRCGGQMKKTFAVPAVHFKGGGWARKEKSTSGRSNRTEPKETAAGAVTSSDGGGSSTSDPAPVADTVSKEPD